MNSEEREMLNPSNTRGVRRQSEAVTAQCPTNFSLSFEQPYLEGGSSLLIATTTN